MDKLEFIAEIWHLCWCSYQLGANQKFNKEMNDDQKVSIKNGIKFVLANPKVTSEENHKNWMEQKISQGWQYGETKSYEKKTHPDLVPYNLLPKVEKYKDINAKMAHDKAVELWKELKQIWRTIKL